MGEMLIYPISAQYKAIQTNFLLAFQTIYIVYIRSTSKADILQNIIAKKSLERRQLFVKY